MTAEEIFKADGRYFGQETLNGIPCAIAYIKEFRWSWFACQLNTFIIVGEAGAIDKPLIETFSKTAYEYALKNNKGWKRGFQSGIGSINILRSSSIDAEAIKYCEKSPPKHWSAFEVPVVYNTADKTKYRYKSTPNWGRLYYPYFSKLIDQTTGRF